MLLSSFVVGFSNERDLLCLRLLLLLVGSNVCSEFVLFNNDIGSG